MPQVQMHAESRNERHLYLHVHSRNGHSKHFLPDDDLRCHETICLYQLQMFADFPQPDCVIFVHDLVWNIV